MDRNYGDTDVESIRKYLKATKRKLEVEQMGINADGSGNVEHQMKQYCITNRIRAIEIIIKDVDSLLDG